MNISNIAHAGLALLFQAIVACLAYFFGVNAFGAAVMGALFAVAFYFGREVAQAERKAGGTPWYVGFNVANWSEDAVFDLLFPLVACSISTAVVFVTL